MFRQRKAYPEHDQEVPRLTISEAVFLACRFFVDDTKVLVREQSFLKEVLP